MEELENKIDKYFDEVTDKQLDKDLEKAGYYFYRSFLVDNADVIQLAE